MLCLVVWHYSFAVCTLLRRILWRWCAKRLKPRQFSHPLTMYGDSRLTTCCHPQGGICRGKPGNFPLSGSDLPSHWFVWNVGGMETGGEGKGEGKGTGDHLAYLLTSPHWLLPQIPPWPSSTKFCSERSWLLSTAPLPIIWLWFLRLLIIE